MTFTTVVHDLLEKDARLIPTEAGQLHIEEADPSASLKKVVIQFPQNYSAMAFSLDFKVTRNKSKSPACLSEVLNASGAHPLRAACDAVICVDEGTRTHIIHIEMKSGKARQRAVQQLRNSRCFTRFLRGLAEEWHGLGDRKFLEWFVLLRDDRTTTRKRGTRIAKTSYPRSQQPSNCPSNPATFSVKTGSSLHLGLLFNRTA